MADLSYAGGFQAYELSPDWSKVAFYDQGALAVMNVDGSDRHRIGSYLSSFAWAPDGRRLVFAAGPQAPNLFTVNADGSELRPLGMRGDSAAWSPDGVRLAFLDTGSVFVSNADGTGRRVLFSGSPSPTRPSWSPEGQRIAFAAGYSLHVVADDGAPLIEIATAFRLFGAQWSPDGAAIALSAEDEGFAVVDLARRAIRNVRGSQPAWSPSGDRLAFIDNKPCSALGVHVVASELKPRHRLTLTCELWGTNRKDVLIGSDQKDMIFGLGGPDRLFGEGFEDELFGGPGRDRLYGGWFGDVLEGGSGNDLLEGGDFEQNSYAFWDDTLVGGPGSDDLRGGPGRDRLAGDLGNDVLRGGDDADVFRGGPGDDRIFASGDPKPGFGRRFRDLINCGSGRDVVYADKVDRITRDCEVVRRS